MEPIRQVEKKYGARALTAAVIAGAVLIALNQVAMGKGLILGCLFSIVNFMLLGGNIPKRVGLSRKGASLKALGSIWVRFLLMAIPLIMAIKLAEFHLVTTVIGIFMVQLAILIDYLVITPVVTGWRKHTAGDM